MAIVKIKENQLDLTNTNAAISGINAKIPSQASSSNQLADKAFVNSSIASNTANFIGTFDSVAELEAYSGTVTNNDYAFVVGTDEDGNTVYDRYKYTTATTPAEWIFEYELNNSSFTAAQWDAINSGATTTNIGQIATNTSNISSLNSTKQDVISDLATIRSGAALGATAVQPSSLATVATSGSYDDLQNKPTIPTVNSPTITLTQGGVTKGSFSLNQSNNDTIALDAGGGDLPDNVYTTDNLVGGDNISIVEQVGDPNTVALWDFEEGTADVVSGITATYGNPLLSTNAKFGNYGMGSDGNSPSAAAYPLSSVLSGTQQITLDWWQLCTKSYFDFLSFGLSTSNNPFYESDYFLWLAQNNSSEVTPYVNGTPTSRVTLSGATPNRYDHYCLTLDADTGAVQFFYNGVRLVNTTVTPFTIDATNLKLVKVGDFFTYVDEIRISNCIRWTEDFTPPTEPYNFGETVYKVTNLLAPSLTWYSGTRGNTLTIADTSAANLVKIYKNGILLQPSADYTISGTTLTMDVSLVETDKIALEVI